MSAATIAIYVLEAILAIYLLIGLIMTVATQRDFERLCEDEGVPLTPMLQFISAIQSILTWPLAFMGDDDD